MTARRFANGMCRVLVFAGVALLGLTGCAAIGPGVLDKDRFDYSISVSDSWKEQMLLNIVKIRYGDAPIFLEVSNIINQYSLETGLDGRLAWSPRTRPTANRSAALAATTTGPPSNTTF